MGRPSKFNDDIAGEWAIYTLAEPGGDIRYVGVTKNPASRMAYHVREARQRKTHRHRWVMSLVDRGQMPIMTVLEWTDDWDAAERLWIARYRAGGCDLVNGNAGGKDMRQARVATSYPHIKRLYRVLESNARCARRYGKNEAADKCEAAKRRLFQNVTIARRRCPEWLAAVNEYVGERFAR